MTKQLPRLQAHWPILLACLIYGVFVLPLIAMQGIAVGGDGILYFYPAMHAFKQALLAGSLPHWTSNVQAGFPLLADGQPSILYPPNTLFLLLLPTPVAYNWTIVFHGLLALFFTYAWGLTLKISRPAAALMSLLFVLSTPLFGSNIPMLQTLAWIPALFWLTERGLRSGRISSLWPVGLIFALQWLAGFPQITVYSLLACSLYFVARLLMEPVSWKERISWASSWLLACSLSLLLAAPLLLPTYELSLSSIRAAGISGAMAGEKSLFPLALIVFLLPASELFWQRAGLGGGAYVGVIPFLVALGTFFRKPKPRWFYPVVVMGVMTAVLAFGRFSPFFPLVREVPGLSLFRVSSRFLIFAQFGLLTLFAWGWDHLWQTESPNANRWQERLFKIAIFLVVLASLVAYPLLNWLKPQLLEMAAEITFRYLVNDSYHLQTEAYYLEKIETLYQNALSALWLWPHTFIFLLTLVGGWLLIRRGSRHPVSTRWVTAILALLIVVDISVAVGGLTAVSPLSWVTEAPPTVQIVKQEIAEASGGAPCRLYTHTDAQAVLFEEELLTLLPANYNTVWDIPATGLYSPLGFRPYYELMDGLGGVNLAFGLAPISAASISQNRALLNALNVCVLTSRERLPDFPLVVQVDDVYIYRNEQALPRAFVVDEVVVVAQGEDVVTAVLENMAQLSTTAVLTQVLPEKLTPGAAATAEVQIQEYEESFVSIAVQIEGVGLLQLTDSLYAGWQAAIDGEPVEIVLTNGQFRGVVVPTGTHEVTFTFVPRTFQVGLAATFVGLFLLMGWIAVWLRQVWLRQVWLRQE